MIESSDDSEEEVNYDELDEGKKVVKGRPTSTTASAPIELVTTAVITSASVKEPVSIPQPTPITKTAIEARPRPVIGPPTMMAMFSRLYGTPLLAIEPASALGYIEVPLDAYGEAVAECSLDDNPAMAAKLEGDIARSRQAVIDFHHTSHATLKELNGELSRRIKLLLNSENKMSWELSERSKEIVKLLSAEDRMSRELSEQSKEIVKKDHELLDMAKQLSRYKELHSMDMRARSEEESRVQKRKAEDDAARRKRMKEHMAAVSGKPRS